MTNRTGQGKLITVWNPLKGGHGSSTIASTLGITLKLKSGLRVLIVNALNQQVKLESFLKNDINTKYSLDNLKGLNEDIDARDITVFSTKITEGLHLLSGPDVTDSLSVEFISHFITQSKLLFDVVVVDIGNSWSGDNKLFLTESDFSISTIRPNVLLFSELSHPSHKETLKQLNAENNIVIFNELALELEAVSSGSFKRLQKNPVIIPHSTELYKIANIDQSLYSYLYTSVDKTKKDEALIRLEELSLDIIYKIDKDLYDEIKKQSIKSWFFKKRKKEE